MRTKPGDIISLHMCTINDDHMMYGFRDMECHGQIFFAILDHFLHFYRPSNFYPIINQNHMMYGSSDMECHRQNFLSFWTIFYPLTNWKTNIFKKWKKCLEIWRYIILQKCIKNHDHMLHCSWNTTRDLLTPPINPKNQNFKKIKRAPGDIFILQMCTTNYDNMMYGPWDMVCNRWTERWTDGPKKWHTEKGAPPKKNITLVLILVKKVYLNFGFCFKILKAQKVTNDFPATGCLQSITHHQKLHETIIWLPVNIIKITSYLRKFKLFNRVLIVKRATASFSAETIPRFSHDLRSQVLAEPNSME